MLTRLKELVDELNQTNSNKDKEVTLKKYPDLKQILSYVYNPYLKYNVSSANVKKMAHLVGDSGSKTIIDVLDDLNARKVTGHDAISLVNGYIAKHPSDAEMVYRILDGNIKARIDEKGINKVFPGTIPTFDVALANKYDDVSNKVNIFDGSWYVSRKLDGLRCLVVIDNDGNISTFSRTGKEFKTLQKVKDDYKSLKLKGIVFDGEICVLDANGKENFTKAISEVSKKDHTVENPCHLIFDCILYSEFIATKGTVKLSDRFKMLNKLIPTNLKHLKVLKQEILTEDLLTAYDKTIAAEGWEGAIFRQNTSYEGKRSNRMLKYKKFFDAEYIIKGVENGDIRFIEDGKEVTKVLLSSIVIEHKGKKVNVGSGFTIDDRKKYYADPKLIIGKTVNVKYFEESVDKDGNFSLRFPTIVHIYENGRNT